MVAGVARDQAHADEDPVERTKAGDASPDGDGGRFFAREANPVGLDENLWCSYLIRGLAEAAEELI